MLALMKPSNVATRSSTRGTSCGCTVVTSTSGGGGAVCAGLREQLVEIDPQNRSAARTINGFITVILSEAKLRHSGRSSRGQAFNRGLFLKRAQSNNQRCLASLNMTAPL